MTTSHKPTYHPAIGRTHAGGYRYDAPRAQYSSRDMATHMTLKTRADLVQRDQQQLREALMASENKHKQGIKDERARQGLIAEDDENDERASSVQLKAEPGAAASAAAASSSSAAAGGTTPLLPSTSGIDFSKFDDDDDDVAAATAAAAHKRSAGGAGGGGGSHDEAAEEDDDDDDSDDEDAELARELDLIRREREEAKLRAAQAEAAEAEAAATASLAANPLLPHLSGAGAGAGPTFGQDTLFGGGGAGAAGGVKRRWDDDVVFKNQAKGLDMTQRNKKRFINDTIRSDFHRAFIGRYVK